MCMMNDYVIYTDSCVDLPAELAARLGLEVLPMAVNLDGEVYPHHLDGRAIANQEFYRLLRARKFSQTSQINPQEFLAAFEPLLQRGIDILSVSFSSALSGTFQSALIAREELAERYPERKLIVLDSLCASAGQGLLLTYAAEMKKRGAGIEEVADWIETNKRKVCHLFTVGDLNHLRRGGRLSATRALIGTLLDMKPLLHVDANGRLAQMQITRGRCRVLAKMVDRMEKTIVKPEGQIVYIAHGDCPEDAEKLRRMIAERLPVKEITIHYIGPVIGSHSGPDTLAVFYLGTDRSAQF